MSLKEKLITVAYIVMTKKETLKMSRNTCTILIWNIFLTHKHAEIIMKMFKMLCLCYTFEHANYAFCMCYVLRAMLTIFSIFLKIYFYARWKCRLHRHLYFCKNNKKSGQDLHTKHLLFSCHNCDTIWWQNFDSNTLRKRFLSF